MEISYCTKWSIAKRKPWKLIDEQIARERHQNRQSYTAILSADGRPSHVVDMANEWVSVLFLDEIHRPYLRYDFKVVGPDKLFLRGGYYWEYEGESNKEIIRKTFTFEENGNSLFVDDNLIANESRTFETHGSVEANWDRYPEFGEYLPICREERE